MESKTEKSRERCNERKKEERRNTPEKRQTTSVICISNRGEEERNTMSADLTSEGFVVQPQKNIKNLRV